MHLSGTEDGSRVLFHALFALHCIVTILIDSMIPITGGMVRIARLLILLGLFVLIFLRREFMGTRYILLGAVLGIASVVTVIESGKEILLITALFILAARGEDFRDICRTYLLSAGGTVCLVVLLCLCGVLEDYTYPHGSAYAHGLGFEYYSTLPFLLFILQIVWMYVKADKVRWWELAVCTLANVVYYRLFTVRLTFLLGVLAILLYAAVVRLKLVDPASHWTMWIARMGYSALLVFVVWLSVAYNADSLSWQAWNTRLNNRIVMLHEAFLRYSLPVLGRRIEMVGQTFVINGGALARDYFYIDSGIGFSVFAFGILFTLLIVALYTYLYTAAGRTGDGMLYVWVSVLLLFTFMNNIWIDLAYNPLLLAVVPMLEKERILRSTT
ncbi:MAG: hypothetical protein IJG52_08190 [Lachnospiraceae bacterium]|nr:hypothetical protein [Lachnospiraceae bacterium]